MVRRPCELSVHCGTVCTQLLSWHTLHQRRPCSLLARQFVKDKSEVRLVGDVKADEKEVVFFFDGDLCFNIPFKPAAAPC